MKLIQKPFLYSLFLALLVLAFASCNTKENSTVSEDQGHPLLLLSSEGISNIKGELNKNVLLDKTYSSTKESLAQLMLQEIDVPIPKDPGGGYTHEKHKKNGFSIYDAAILYQTEGDEKYARYVEQILLSYAAIYPDLDLHPERKEQTPGKLFWQSLNECVWLVYAAQAYDLTYNFLSVESRTKIEEGVFLPMTDFLSKGSAYTFNRIHNHGTWAVAAVGMAGYVLQDQDLIDISLKGLNKDGNGGFLAQLDQLFSPDGYYTEGPYYQRYAMMPFILFAESIEKNNPEINIYAHNDSILKKAVNTTFQLSYTNGYFFPFNDAIKSKSIETIEMVYAANIIYSNNTSFKELLDISDRQKRISLTDAGIHAAMDWNQGQKKTFNWESVYLSDGNKGDKGGIGILRSGSVDDQSCLLMKYSSHGLSHGHYDKLTFLYYDNNTPIIRDYGAARFLNIAAKFGGRYLPENKTWANQSIAHNTVTIDERSHFGGDFKTSSKNNPIALSFNAQDTDLQWMSALDTNAYPGSPMRRMMVMVEIPSMDHPIILDIFNIDSDKKHQFDLPFYYNGQAISTNFPAKYKTTEVKPMGADHGYQHLWEKGVGTANNGLSQFTWLCQERFYTLSSITDANTEIIFASIGANDPNNNLRNEPAIILRQKDSDQHTFVNVIEPHGSFDPVSEITNQSESSIADLQFSGDYKQSRIIINLKNGEEWMLEINLNKEVSIKQTK